MTRPRSSLFGGAAFRLAALSAVLLSVVVLAFSVIVFLSVRASLKEQLEAQIENEAIQLLADYHDDGLEELRHDIRERIEHNQGNRLLYGLTDPSGRTVFDGIEPAETNGFRVLERPGRSALIVKTTVLDDGYRFSVANDTQSIVAFSDALGRRIALVALVIIAFSVGAGLLMSRWFLARLSRLKRVADSFGAGNFSERVVIRGTDEFEQLGITINDMLNRIEKLMEEVQYVSTSIAHDLRTPLGRLRQDLEGLRKLQATAESEALVVKALTRLDDALETFASLLRIAELESGNASLEMHDFDLSELLASLFETYEGVAESRGQTLSYAEPPPPPSIIRGDRQLIAQMFVNAIENAIKHNAEGISVTISLNQRGKTSCVTIADDGVGMPANQGASLIKRFHRGDASRRVDGAGLGLSLVATIAARHEIRWRLEDRRPGLAVVFEFNT